MQQIIHFMQNEDIAKFYDSYTAYQLSKKINIRHRTIFSLLKKFGLRSNSSVLEIGCGIGTLTSLMANFLNDGKIVAVDISPQSIDIAKKIICKKFSNIEFIVSDMQNFSHENKFDFIVLPDVLEHIPIEKHHKLFYTLSQQSKENSRMLINIPSPLYQRWLIKNKPELLQIIDQPLDSNHIVNVAYDNNFYLISMSTYSLHVLEGDYQYFLFGVGKEPSLNNVTHFPYFQKAIREIRSRINLFKINSI